MDLGTRRIVSAAVAALLVLVAWVYLAGPVRVAPAPAGASSAAVESFRFASVGDFGHTGTADMLAMAKRVKTANASFLLALGDLGYAPDESAWCSSIKGAFNGVEVVAGNHDAGENSGGNISKYAIYCPFTLNVTVTAGPSTPGYGFEYYFDYPAANPLARFILIVPGVLGWLNYDYTPGSPHFDWVVNAVNDARAHGIPWVVVGMHEVCLDAGSYGCSIGPGLFNKLIELKVDLILQAHYHSYQRSKQLALNANCTSVPLNAFDADCVANDGAPGRYPKGGGSVVVIDGAGGESLYSVALNGTDPEFNYMVATMGSNGNTENLSSGYGAAVFTVSRNRVDEEARFCPAGSTNGTGECPGQASTTFSDGFAIAASPGNPFARFTYSPGVPFASQPMTFDASTSSDPDPTSVLQARWDWQADGTWDTAWSFSLLAQHTFASPGTYRVALEILDSAGLTNATVRTFAVFAPDTGVGAPPGYGLSDPASLEPHGPIYIGNDSQFTAANGVRHGSGTPADPYVIANWSFDGNLYPNANAMVWVENTTHAFVIENNRVTNLTWAGQWAAIQLGRWPDIVMTWNATIRHNTVVSQHAYGVYVNEGSHNVRVEANSVSLNASREWVYGAVAMRGTHNVTFYGNYVDAYTNGTFHTVGIHLSDYFVSEARDATGLVAERNTVANATAGGIISESSHGTVVRGNLLYMDYPGAKSVAFNYPRGIETEWLSNETVVVGNVIHTFHWGIQVGSDRDRIVSNRIYDVDYAVYILDNGSWEGVSSFGDSIFNTTYWNVSQSAIRLPPNPQVNVVDLGPGIRTDDFSPVLLVTEQTPSQITYAWSGQVLNLSATVGGDTLYDVRGTAENQTLGMSWSGAVSALDLSRFLPTNVSFRLQGATDIVIAGSGFSPNAAYDVLRWGVGGAVAVLTTNTSAAGSLRFSLPAAGPSLFSIVPHVVVDTAPPSTAIALSGTAGNQGWYTSAVNVTLTATDAGSGVAAIRYRLDGGAWQTYSGPYSVRGDGTHSLEYYTTDVAGNIEPAHTAAVRIDTTPPATTSNVSGIVGGGGWYTSAVNVTLGATDAASGVAAIRFRIDGGSWQLYAGPFAIQGDGTHSFESYAVDAAGNVEPAHIEAVLLDTKPPTTTCAISGRLTANGSYLDSANASLSSIDGTSGVASIEYRIDNGSWQPYAGAIRIVGNGTHTVDYAAVDLAGNVEGVRHVSVRIAGAALAPPTAEPPLAGEPALYLLFATVAVAVAAVALVLSFRRRGRARTPRTDPEERRGE